MPDQHARTRIAHDLPHLLTQRWTVTVNLAVGAGRFVFAVWATRESFLRIGMQDFAFGAKRLTSVVVAAVDAQHRPDRLKFARKARFQQPSAAFIGGRHSHMVRSVARHALRWIKICRRLPLLPYDRTSIRRPK
jgi:hypothetical protein